MLLRLCVEDWNVVAFVFVYVDYTYVCVHVCACVKIRVCMYLRMYVCAYEFKVLDYNLNFIPTPPDLSKKQLMEDIFQFKRNIHLKAHFGNTSTPDPNSEATRFKPPTNKIWVSQQVHHTVNTFVEAFENDIKEDLSTVISRYSNTINKDELKALN